MHFCSVCSNMYYISITPDNEMQYYCRNCGNIDNTIASENICVSKVNVRHKTTPQTFSQVVNKYTKYDPTLPRIHTIRCPNDECPTKTEDEEPDVVPVEIDSKNLVWLYQCAICSTTWTQSGGAPRTIVSS